MSEITATDAARHFAEVLDAIEHRGEHFTIVRRGRVIAHLEPASRGKGADVKALMARHHPDDAWSDELASTRALVTIDDRS